MSAPNWAKGMRQIGPGVYGDARGRLHLSARELCAHAGAEPTPQNRRAALAGIRSAWREHMPEILQDVVEHEDD